MPFQVYDTLIPPARGARAHTRIICNHTTAVQLPIRWWWRRTVHPSVSLFQVCVALDPWAFTTHFAMRSVQLGSALHVEWALPPSVGSPAPVSRVLHVSRLPLTCANESGENDVDESVPGSALFLRCMFEPYGQLTRVKVGGNGGSGEGLHPH